MRPTFPEPHPWPSAWERDRGPVTWWRPPRKWLCLHQARERCACRANDPWIRVSLARWHGPSRVGSLGGHVVRGRSISTRNCDPIESQKHSQLCPMMNEVIHHSLSKHLRPGHVYDGFACPTHLPLPGHHGIIRPSQLGSRIFQILIKPSENFLFSFAFTLDDFLLVVILRQRHRVLLECVITPRGHIR